MADAIVKHLPQPVASIVPFSPEQRELIKRTVAPGATDDELAMFLHVAQRSGLDPLRKQIHFLKVGGRCAFIADVNGLQARAAQEADFEGLLHAVVYEKDAFEVNNTTGEVVKHIHNPLGNNGGIVGAWATVRRKGMLPFTAVVRFKEYENNNNPLWKSKPAVMIDKVAKSTALRLAYPVQLGSLMDESEAPQEREVNAAPAPAEPPKPRESHYQRICREMEERNVPKETWSPVFKELMGSRTKLALITAADVEKMLAAFPLPPDEVPPPNDADAQFPESPEGA